MFALLIHIYYPHSWTKIIRDNLLPLKKYNPVILVNISNNDNHLLSIFQEIRKDFPNAFITCSPNKGKDIGGKFILIDLFLKMKFKVNYVVFLHDKHSPHAIRGEKWRTSLFSIIEPRNVHLILEQFAKDKKMGIAAPASFIMNEYNADTKQFMTNNHNKIQELLDKYGLVVDDYNFIGGAMFWIRSLVLESFFAKITPLACREILEAGNILDNIDGTYTHSWERIFCWISTAQGYSIKGF